MEAIAALKDFLEKQFDVLNERLDRIEENITALQITLDKIVVSLDEVRWMIGGLVNDTRNMETELTLGTLLILEEIDEQKTIEWDAIMDGKLALDAQDVVLYKAFFHSRVIDSFDQLRVLDPAITSDPFKDLRLLTRALSTQRGSDLLSFVADDKAGKTSAPTALLLSAINHYTAQDLAISTSSLARARTALNPTIALGAMERWLQVDAAQKSVDKLDQDAKGLAKLSRRHLKTMSQAMDCIEGIAGMVRPPQVKLADRPADTLPTSTFEALMRELDNQVDGFEKDLDLVEWLAVCSYLVDISKQPTFGAVTEEHFAHWPTTPIPTANNIPLNIDPDQDQEFPYYKYISLEDQYITRQIPSLFVRNLTGSGTSPLAVTVIVPEDPQFVDDAARIPVGAPGISGTMTVEYELSFKFYDATITRIPSSWATSLYYSGLLKIGDAPTSDWIWSRMQGEKYIRHPRRHYFWSLNQPQDNGSPDHAWFDVTNRTIQGAVRSRLTDEYNKSMDWIENANVKSLREAHAKAKADPNEQTTAALLENAIHPIRTAILNDYLLARHSVVDDATLARLRARLNEMQNILATIRASLLVSMPDAYLNLDLLHVLFDGNSESPQLCFPDSTLIESDKWKQFSDLIDAECKKPRSDISPLLNISNYSSINDPQPAAQMLRKCTYLLKICIDKMTAASPKASVSVRVDRVSRLLRDAEVSAGLLPGGPTMSRS